MILIGQFDSPFVRRVAIALRLYGIAFEHRPWSVFGDAEKIQAYNPLIRVPTLMLDNGEVLVESHSILDYLDRQVPASQAMFPQDEPARHQALKVAALATGVGEKSVSLFYELRLHSAVSALWVARCGSQIKATLAGTANLSGKLVYDPVANTLKQPANAGVSPRSSRPKPRSEFWRTRLTYASLWKLRSKSVSPFAGSTTVVRRARLRFSNSL